MTTIAIQHIDIHKNDADISRILEWPMDRKYSYCTVNDIMCTVGIEGHCNYNGYLIFLDEEQKVYQNSRDHGPKYSEM